MKLTENFVGKQVRIKDVSSVSDLVKRRLVDFGIMEGSVIKLKKTLPFGGPFTIESEGQWIAIRRREALNIQVEAVI
jgi:ferrous iron transport protein A